MNEFRHNFLDKVSASISTFTVNLHDYRMVSPTVARVILSYTGSTPAPDEVRARINKMMDGNAVAIAGSFRELTRAGDVKSLIGFVKASREVLPFDEVTASSGKYKALASNLLRQTEDDTLWEIKSGAAGKYLAKQTAEDLRSLMHLAQATCSGLPKFNQIASLASNTQPREFAAYVDLNAEEVMHGYVVASSDDKVTVIAKETGESVEIAADQMIHVLDLEGEDAQVAGTQMAAEVAADKGAMIEYYNLAYRYDPAYIQKIIEMIDQHATA